MKKLSKYLLWAFGAAWVLQIIAGVLYRKGNSMGYSVVLAVSMFVPLLAAVLSGAKIRRIGWKLPVGEQWSVCSDVCSHQYSICNYIRSICEYAACHLC